ncbi:MAG: GTPase Era [Candidatus Rokubacteria bacterium GWC2_70_16]|nr:MAG: GTPase Era [Candidatus Rokubacteria bacterium GWC2_70_16]OGL21022.1 MAG: GTPase Era [Candidatus Rokubacteria bacterium RIFCSPLOWO2_12_FULL_71_19]
MAGRAHRAGFVALIGRPNVGKSTLLNRLVGAKMAIVSRRPQTTRTRITGIKHLPDAQIVFVDTPGLHTGSSKLGRLMAKAAERALEDVDLVCLVAEATERPDRLDAGPLARLAGVGAPVFCCLNKADLVTPKSRLLPLIEAYRARHPFQEIIPISAERGTNCGPLLDLIAQAMPERPAYFPRESATDQPETFFVAERIREKIFHLTHQEVPYACAVRVEELRERERPECLYIRATIFVEQESQKGIVIGQRGAMLKRIGSSAREDLERFFGIKTFLDLHVRVRKNWRKDDSALREFGFLLTS